MRTRRWITVIALAGAMMSIVPAQAAPVTVKLRVSLATNPAAVWACNVAVEAGSNGLAVLDAAKSKGCISSYSTTEYPPAGHFVDCINGICGQLVTYWAMYENGSYTSYGVSGFRADPGDELGFTYEQWVTCLVPGAC